VVAEGTGQDLLENKGEERDASGNVKLRDIGPFLREKIEAYFRAEKIPMVMRYLEPSYIIRSVPPMRKTRFCATNMPVMPCMPRWQARPAW